jgi:outer membrane protein assembly factor BamB
MSSIQLAVLALSIAAPAPKAGESAAGDWPQWRGVHRDGHSTSTGLLQKWPEGGPKLVFKTDKIGAGYSSPAVVGGKMYIMGTDAISMDKPEGENSVLYCLDALTGKENWKQTISKISDVPIKDWGGFPRSTPTVDGDQVFALTAQGDLACFNAADGKKVWAKNLKADLGGGVPGWGYSESVLIDGDKLICTPGGGKGALAALDKKTGKELWRSTDITDNAGYSSVIIADVGGFKHYVQQSMAGTFGVNPADGKKLWRVENKAYKVAVIPTPVFYKDHVFATAGYSAGCKLIKLAKTTDGIDATTVYTSKGVSNHHGGVVQVDDYLYTHDATAGRWVCLKFITTAPEDGDPKFEWISKKQEKGSVTYADGCLYTYGENKGACALIKADPKDWIETGRFTIPETSKIRSKKRGQIWTHPVIANGKLYLRDYEWLFCFDVAAK